MLMWRALGEVARERRRAPGHVGGEDRGRRAQAHRPPGPPRAGDVAVVGARRRARRAGSARCAAGPAPSKPSSSAGRSTTRRRWPRGVEGAPGVEDLPRAGDRAGRGPASGRSASPGRTTQVALRPVTAPRWTRQISPSSTWPGGHRARRRAGERRPAPGLAQPLGVHLGHAPRSAPSSSTCRTRRRRTAAGGRSTAEAGDRRRSRPRPRTASRWAPGRGSPRRPAARAAARARGARSWCRATPTR